ncbi:hypothetical protein [Bradyrhizobium sp. CCH5-F6]|uniref:hypothetical protein n=1 Tax=Bradyrhizobium sp. CCH5-F6 TaxID=1768753 RepID=UPI0012E3D05D|nr:hypothetical protein [Bradyrhizobium sp. CCH5-F6]
MRMIARLRILRAGGILQAIKAPRSRPSSHHGARVSARNLQIDLTGGELQLLGLLGKTFSADPMFKSP